MENNSRNIGSLVAGGMLVLFGSLALASQLIGGFNFWNNFWPLIIVGFGLMFFVGMVAGGKSVAALAIPGSIISGIGLMMLVQNLTNHWESWSYGWTVIIMAVGVGIWIMGRYGDNQPQRESGLQLVGIGAVLFIIFGAFFELLFNSSRVAQIGFPVLLILLGAYLLISRAGLLQGSARNEAPATEKES